MPGPDWTADDRFVVGDTEFRTSFESASTSSSFFIRKHRQVVDDLVVRLDGLDHPNLFELGIAAGGSVALLHLLAEPRKLVAVELSPDPVQGLADFVAQRGAQDVVRPYYGVDQSDRARLAEIVTREFGGEPIDLVIDDASHLLGPTRASFEVLFPHLRPGGLYLIEDWNWDQKLVASASTVPHARDRWTSLVEQAIAEDPAARQAFEDRIRAAIDDPTSPDDERIARRFAQATQGEAPEPPTPAELLQIFPTVRDDFDGDSLLTFAFELVLARASAGEAIAEVAFGPWWIEVRRGPQVLTSGAFRVDDLYHDAFGLLNGPARLEPAPGTG
jgi:predicted O-methyltransferase YrrM